MFRCICGLLQGMTLVQTQNDLQKQGVGAGGNEKPSVDAAANLITLNQKVQVG
jgi:hypothetical protein